MKSTPPTDHHLLPTFAAPHLAFMLGMGILLGDTLHDNIIASVIAILLMVGSFATFCRDLVRAHRDLDRVRRDLVRAIRAQRRS